MSKPQALLHFSPLITPQSGNYLMLFQNLTQIYPKSTESRWKIIMVLVTSNWLRPSFLLGRTISTIHFQPS